MSQQFTLITVHAWKRMKMGAFSTSARVATFLTGLSTLNVEAVHKPGKDMVLSDYNSRHPVACKEEKCKICQFAFDLVTTGNALVNNVRSITVQDIENGLVRMPQFQKASWMKIQADDRVHSMFLKLVADGKIPEKKKKKEISLMLKDCIICIE